MFIAISKEYGYLQPASIPREYHAPEQVAEHFANEILKVKYGYVIDDCQEEEIIVHDAEYKYTFCCTYRIIDDYISTQTKLITKEPHSTT